tara:strand:+ start:145 stop:393 length:249 start_codon:yes stop_codon:yes gene_type:complete
MNLKFNADVASGKVTLQDNFYYTRENGEFEAGWTENMSLCSTTSDPNYDPHFFDNYCSFFYWCWRDYTSDCEPNFAFGVTET